MISVIQLLRAEIIFTNMHQPLFLSWIPALGVEKHSLWIGIPSISRKRNASFQKIYHVKQRDENWQAWKREKLVAQTKTESGKRVIPLNEKAIDALNQIKAYNKKRGISSKYVISSESGEHITERNLFRTLEYICGACGIKRIGVHGLRHTFASTLISKRCWGKCC